MNTHTYELRRTIAGDEATRNMLSACANEKRRSCMKRWYWIIFSFLGKVLTFMCNVRLSPSLYRFVLDLNVVHNYSHKITMNQPFSILSVQVVDKWDTPSMWLQTENCLFPNMPKKRMRSTLEFHVHNDILSKFWSGKFRTLFIWISVYIFNSANRWFIVRHTQYTIIRIPITTEVWRSLFIFFYSDFRFSR